MAGDGLVTNITEIHWTGTLREKDLEDDLGKLGQEFWNMILKKVDRCGLVLRRWSKIERDGKLLSAVAFILTQYEKGYDDDEDDDGDDSGDDDHDDDVDAAAAADGDDDNDGL
ncbi:hypothetical protein ElyMa_001680900 [Elysia marginata]|uniref:Uncharacterized protein n=1 Tax=Elysia marginata TaxID=1093978 RepID=A0AAV4JTW7_9GAST|nr:hypothetical protein ElyMa_001680900 [Elysia marginata]